jgi:hypothetical protein
MGRTRYSIFIAAAGLAIAAWSPARGDKALLPSGVEWPPAPAPSDPPPGAIEGFFDPVTKAFTPLAAPSASTATYRMQVTVPLNFHFANTSAGDWATIRCQSTVSYRAPNNRIVRSSGASAGFSGFSNDPALSSPHTITTSAETNARGYVSVQCTSFDDQGHGYSTTQIKSFPIGNSTVTVPFTFNLP